MLSVETVLVFAVLVITVETEYYTRENTTLIFNFFKEKYNKKYTEKDEEEAYKNFVKNLNKVTTLNANPKDKDVIYTLNKYADIDTDEVQEHFALNLSSYDINEVHKGPAIRNRHVLRNKMTPKPDGQDLLSVELYDLDDAEELFIQYMTAFGKNNATKKYGRTVHFYKFVKSLVDINRDHYKGTTDRTIDENADIVVKPNDYFY